MHLLAGTHDAAAMHLGDGLMSQTNPKGWSGGGQILEHLQADAGLVRIARTRREQDGVRLQFSDLRQGEGVVAVHLEIRSDGVMGSQLTEVLHQVEGEAVVVVDDQQHRRNLRNSGGGGAVEAIGTERSAGS